MQRATARIVSIAPNGQPEKRNKPFATSWFMPITYTLEDGQRVDATYGPCSLKRDAIRGGQPREVNNMVANFDEDGKFIGTTTTFDTIDFLRNQARL